MDKLYAFYYIKENLTLSHSPHGVFNYLLKNSRKLLCEVVQVMQNNGLELPKIQNIQDKYAQKYTVSKTNIKKEVHGGEPTQSAEIYETQELHNFNLLLTYIVDMSPTLKITVESGDQAGASA